MYQSNRVGAMICLMAGLLLNTAWAFDATTQQLSPNRLNERQICKDLIRGAVFSRTELFFGLSRANGPDITEAEFQNFIDAEVTLRFPDGLTLLSGKGQFKDSSGTIVQENSKQLILFYNFNPENHQAIETIRSAYKNDFQQESVLRADEQQCVSF